MAHHDVRTTVLVAGGAALGRLPDGRAVFVDGGAPDEQVRVELTHESAKWAKARIVEVLEPSASRIEPPFPLSALGGATWAHLTYASQLEAKEAIVRTALERIGGLQDPSVQPIVPSPAEWRYRNRVELTFGSDNGRVVLGTLAPGSATQVIAADDVALFDDVACEIIPRVTRWAQESDLGEWSRRAEAGALRSLILRRSLATDQLVINLVITSAAPPDQTLVAALKGIPTTGILWSRSGTRPGDSQPFQTKPLTGKPRLTEIINNYSLGYHANSFFQVNVEATALLVTELQRRMGSPKAVIDLYAGVGLLSLTTTDSSTPLTLVESHPQSIRDASYNAKELDRASSTTLVESTAEQYVKDHRLPERATVILDPPRAGLDRAVVDALLAARLDKVLYISCDPATLARDLKLLLAKYTPTYIQPFDFFPQTPHVETLVELTPINT